MIRLEDTLDVIPGIGSAYIKRLKTIGLSTVSDLLFYFPFRYETFSRSVADELVPDSKVIVEGTIAAIENIRTRTGKTITKGLLQRHTGLLPITWFNQPYLVKNLSIGTLVRMSGKLQEFSHAMTLISPKWERIQSLSIDQAPQVSSSSEENGVENTELRPVYSETYGINSGWIKDRVKYLLANLKSFPKEFIPNDLLDKHRLYPLELAIRSMHFPDSVAQADEANRRFAYEEILLAQVRSTLQRQLWRSQKLDFNLNFAPYSLRIDELYGSLPFTLTDAQMRSVQEILNDLMRDEPMNRLLEGDVGSGKTIVAAVAMYAVFLCGYRSVLMAPTQILATQHYESIMRVLGDKGVTVELVIGGGKRKAKRGEGIADVYIGTHALLFSEEIPNVALTVIDEQHRFGVAQRAQLRSMHGLSHVLSMTATPIPRTLALTLYGDLDLSVIDEMPPGRKVIKTWVVGAAKRVDAYGWIEKFIADTGEQVFIVCPFVEPSESSDTIKAAVHEYERLKRDVFPQLRIGLLHGKMKGEEKDTILTDFRNRVYDILVCTPVVEVGIDIPRASIIVIESAERFGLAQLHQFRGRVGRGGQQAYCMLFTSSPSQEDSVRLQALEHTHSGIALAEIDLKYRGAGNIFGRQQSGRVLFKYVDFTNILLISEAKQDAEELIRFDLNLEGYPLLLERIQQESAFVEAN